MLRTAWSPKATATAINPLKWSNRGRNKLSPTQYVSNLAPPNTQTLTLSLCKIHSIQRIHKELFMSKNLFIRCLLYIDFLLFSIYLRISAPLCHSLIFCINLFYLPLSPWLTSLCAIFQCHLYRPFFFCSPSASPSPLSIIHLGYNRSIISNNTSVAPRGEKGELCWAWHTHCSRQPSCKLSSKQTKSGQSLSDILNYYRQLKVFEKHFSCYSPVMMKMNFMKFQISLSISHTGFI